MGVRTLSHADRMALEELDARLKTILPEEYQDSYEGMEPVPMRSAGLKYDSDGKVAWNEIWGSFCDLAMAGGPPHKGALLEAGRPADIDAEPDRYAGVAEEICRGVMMTTLLDTNVSPVPGWVRDLLPQRRDDRLAPPRHRHGERRGARRGDGARSARGAAFPSRERDQERHHRDREDLALLARAHAARPAARHRQPVRAPRQRVTAGRTIHDGRRTGSGCGGPVGGDPQGYRPSDVQPVVHRLARRGLPQRAQRHLDDAGAGCRQRPVAPRGDDAVRPGESTARIPEASGWRERSHARIAWQQPATFIEYEAGAASRRRARHGNSDPPARAQSGP